MISYIPQCHMRLSAAMTSGIAVMAVMAMCACGHRASHPALPAGDTLTTRHAKLLTLVQHKGYTEAVIADPWKQGAMLHRYYLVPHADSARFMPPAEKGDIVYTPVRRAVVALSSLCQLATWMNGEQRIKGTCDCQYIRVPQIRRMLDRHAIADCGSSMSPSVEAIASVNADALFLSPFQGAAHGRVGQMGIPIIECAEYMEETALGRAEWMKLYGRLLGNGAKADSLFRAVERQYEAVSRQAAKAKTRPGVLTERVTSGTWYCPGGNSTMASMIADANGQYVFSADRHSGSLPLAPETVVAQGDKADVWFFVAAGQHPLSRKALQAEYHGYTRIKAFNTGRVYQCANLSTSYFDELSFRPDLVLQDIVWMLHPELDKGHRMRYFVQSI